MLHSVYGSGNLQLCILKAAKRQACDAIAILIDILFSFSHKHVPKAFGPVTILGNRLYDLIVTKEVIHYAFTKSITVILCNKNCKSILTGFYIGIFTCMCSKKKKTTHVVELTRQMMY